MKENYRAQDSLVTGSSHSRNVVHQSHPKHLRVAITHSFAICSPSSPSHLCDTVDFDFDPSNMYEDAN